MAVSEHDESIIQADGKTVRFHVRVCDVDPPGLPAVRITERRALNGDQATESELIIFIDGQDSPKRTVTIEEATLGITSLHPPTAKTDFLGSPTLADLRAFVEVGVRALEAGVSSSVPGFLDGPGAIMLRYKGTAAANLALRELGYEL